MRAVLALRDLYAYCYSTSADEVLGAAALRAEAMGVSPATIKRDWALAKLLVKGDSPDLIFYRRRTPELCRHRPWECSSR